MDSAKRQCLYKGSIEASPPSREKSIFLDVDGAMSYAMVWLNGKLMGGWPFGYASWRLNLTPYIIPGGNNQLAIRLDNPAESSRWYPGGGLYRNVWLVKTEALLRVTLFGNSHIEKPVRRGAISQK